MTVDEALRDCKTSFMLDKKMYEKTNDESARDSAGAWSDLAGMLEELKWWREQNLIRRDDAIKGIRKDVFEDICDAETCHAINGTSCPCGSGCNNPCGICYIKNMDKAQYKGE